MNSGKRTYLLTGASSGIGYAITRQLLDLGHHVIGLGRDFSKVDLPIGQFTAIEIDLSDLKQLPEALKQLTKTHADIQGLICCAGQGRFGSLEEFSYKQINQLMDINFTSHAYLCRALVPSLKKLDHSEIIFIGSEAALAGSKMGSIYCASKFALRGFAQALRAECAGNGVRVSIINPGMVNTEFFDTLNFEPGQDEENFILPDDIANAVTMIINARPGTNFDEINLSPLKKVVQAKKK